MLRIAIIGLGNIGTVHTEILLDKGLPLVAVCDINEKILHKFPAIKGYVDYKKMIDEVKPNVVHICTPHYLHAEMIVYALKKNINVLCEKPMCINREEAKKILEAEKSSKGILGICFQNRFSEKNKFIKDYLKDKTIKNISAFLFWNRGKEYYGTDEWRGKKLTEGGGVLINQAIHTIDIACWLCGGFQYVSSNVCNVSLNGVIEVEDSAVVLCSGKSEFSLLASNASRFDFPVEMAIQTEQDVIIVKSDTVEINSKIYRFDSDSYYGKPCYGLGHSALFDEFYKCVESGAKFSIDGAEGYRALQIVLAAYESKGCKVKIK